MLIHELTKRRTDEGILDGVKGAISQKATAIYKDTTQAMKDKVAGVKGIPGQIKQDYLGGIKTAKRAGEENPLLARMAGVKNAYNAAGDRSQEKQWDKNQNKINKQAADAAKVLARKGFNVDTTTPAAQAQTPARVKQQKLSQLQQEFDQEFDVGYELNPNAAQMHAQQQANKARNTKLQQTIAAQNKQMSLRSGIKEDNVQMSPGGIAIPAGAKTANRTTKKDIATEFISWIQQKIPGLDKVSDAIKTKLNGIFAQMKTLKGNPKAIDAAFQKYVDLALSAVSSAQQAGQQTQQAGQQTQQGGKLNASVYAAQGAARALGIPDSTIKALQNRVQQAKEPAISRTGSNTIDTIAKAIGLEK